MDDGLKTPKVVIKEEQEMKGTLKDLFKVKRHFKNLLLMIYIWIASSFGLYLVQFQMKYLPGSIYMNTILSAACDIPGSIIGGMLYKKFGVRFTLPIFYALSVAGSLCILFFGRLVGEESVINSIFVMLARVGVNTAMSMCYIANAGIFPAIFGGTAFGLCNLGAKFFTIFAPMMAEVSAPVPMITFSVVTVLAIGAALMIKVKPE